ncbi:MAG: hypothetical protein ACNA7K_01960 [Acholeplasmataceae bacterium]
MIITYFNTTQKHRYDVFSDKKVNLFTMIKKLWKKTHVIYDVLQKEPLFILKKKAGLAYVLYDINKVKVAKVMLNRRNRFYKEVMIIPYLKDYKDRTCTAFGDIKGYLFSILMDNEVYLTMKAHFDNPYERKIELYDETDETYALGLMFAVFLLSLDVEAFIKRKEKRRKENFEKALKKKI